MTEPIINKDALEIACATKAVGVGANPEFRADHWAWLCANRPKIAGAGRREVREIITAYLVALPDLDEMSFEDALTDYGASCIVMSKAKKPDRMKAAAEEVRERREIVLDRFWRAKAKP